MVPREQRLCPYCNGDVGSELHGLLESNSAKLLNLKDTFLPRILCICPQVHKLSVFDSFLYFMKCHDTSITTIFAEWVNKCNESYKVVLLSGTQFAFPSFGLMNQPKDRRAHVNVSVYYVLIIILTTRFQQIQIGFACVCVYMRFDYFVEIDEPIVWLDLHVR